MTEQATGGQVAALARRLGAINWRGSDAHTNSRGYLMKEYLRRAAWWAQATNAPGYPFFDIAAAVNPGVRADPNAVQWVSEQLTKQLQGTLVIRVAGFALHFAALLDARVPLPPAPEQPFEPLVALFERGGGFRREGAGLIEVDTLGVRVGTVQENLRPEPWVSLDRAALDALDG
jgi:hypothetical protein